MSDLNSKAETLICKKYISIDSKRDLEFNDQLKVAIDKKSISKEDALFIVLDLMYNVDNYDLDYPDIEAELENLVLKVEEFNYNDQAYLKKTIFYKDYSIVKEILNVYVKKLETQKHNDKKSKKVSENIRLHKPTLKEIKNNLNHLSKEDLCYILDKNPELTFEKEKILKNQIAEKFNEYPVDINKLKDSSREDIKTYFNNLIEESCNEPDGHSLKIMKISSLSVENIDNNDKIGIDKIEPN